ncbi:hypothetical protein [Nitratireductor sp. XY-223]|uniref:hypothetical protein n=1 Tax=Nitratireductor sp. XY-223 TaxID=2561926 RepID=UPI0010AA7FC6|nr:hypothetical protein [Nitratireductor sp. XY-223]
MRKIQFPVVTVPADLDICAKQGGFFQRQPAVWVFAEVKPAETVGQEPAILCMYFMHAISFVFVEKVTWQQNPPKDGRK